MKHLRIAVILTVIAVALWAGPVAASDIPGGHLMVVPNQLQWVNVSSLPAGARMATIQGSMSEAAPFTVRLKLPANYRVPAHSHPATEHITVLSGTLNFGMGDKLDKTKSRALPPGSVTIMEAGMTHFVWTTKATVLQLQGVGPWGINYVNPQDDPRNR